MTASNTATIEVVAAIIRRPQEVLLTYRNAKQHQGERWEFPGGKVEKNETLREALARELDEELGICPVQSNPFLTLSYTYPEKTVRLHFFDVWQFSGEPNAREAQPMRWWPLKDLLELPFPEANVPVVKALQLPEQWFVLTVPAEEAEAQLDKVLAQEVVQGVYLRGNYHETLLKALVQRCKAADCLTLLPVKEALQLHAVAEQARQLGVTGVHLPEAVAMAVSGLPHYELLYSMACHNPASLAKGQALGVDMAFLSPVNPTLSHPEAPSLGWLTFSRWVKGSSIPVYALGGVGPADLVQARDAGARGVAGISGYLR